MYIICIFFSPGYKNFMLAIHSQAKALSKISSPSSSLLKLDLQHSPNDYCNDILYDKEKSSHRLSTSSDIPGIEGTLVLQTSNVSKEDEISSSESEESSDSQNKENQTSECSIC